MKYRPRIYYTETDKSFFGNIPYRLSHVLKNRFSQETKVVRLVPVLTHDLFAERNALFRGKFLRYLRVILAQPGPELFLGAHDDRPNCPERVIEIKCNGANTMQGMFPKNDLKTIVVL